MQTAEYQHTATRNKLIRHLTALPALLEDLDVTLTMQAKTGGTGAGGISLKERNAFNVGASEVMALFHSLLSRICNTIDKDLGRYEYLADVKLMARKALPHAGWLADNTDADTIVVELVHLIGEALRIIDRPENKVFAGICPTDTGSGKCDAAVYAVKGNPNATCRKCGSTWDVSDWRRRAVDAALMHHGTPAQISRALSDDITGEALPQGTIRQWVHRGKLTPVGADVLGRPVYQIRKVRNLWDRMKERQRRLVA